MTLEVNDIVQITDPEQHWFPALLVVDEVKGWGIQAYAWIPKSNSEPASQAYIRLETGKYEKVGEALVLPGEAP